MTTFDTPHVAWRGAPDADAPLIVLLHGRGSNENDIIALADHLPAGAAYAAVRAPIAEGGGYAWFANPSDLFDRTWTYLHGDAGSTTTGVRDPGGHDLTAATVTEPHRWLQALPRRICESRRDVASIPLWDRSNCRRGLAGATVLFPPNREPWCR